MATTTKLNRVQILEEPKLVFHDDGSTTKVLAIEKSQIETQPNTIAAGINTSRGQCELLNEFNDNVVARMPGTFVVGVVNGESVIQRVVREKYWGGTRRPFYEKRIRRAQKKVGTVVMSYLATT